LEERYKTQKCGGAFDVKSIKTESGTRMPLLSSDGVSSPISDIQWTAPQFSVKSPILQTEFNDKALNRAEAIGVATIPYKK
jgi:hypothetical protein